MPGLILSNIKLALETRRRSPISNFLTREAPQAGAVLQKAGYKARYKGTFRDVGPCNSYNCHGLTFACRRTAIMDAKEIKKILSEDDYSEVPRKDVLPGDVAIYFSTGDIPGDIEHSGLVVERVEDRELIGPRIKILSKWGYCDEVIHFAEDCPYDIKDIKYYRVTQ